HQCRAKLAQFARFDGFDRRLGTYRGKDRSRQRAVRGMEHPGTGRPAGCLKIETKHEPLILSKQVNYISVTPNREYVAHQLAKIYNSSNLAIIISGVKITVCRFDTANSAL